MYSYTINLQNILLPIYSFSSNFFFFLMIKQIHSFSFLVVLFSLLTFHGTASFAQDKKERKAPVKEKGSTVEGNSTDKLLPVVQQEKEDGKVKTSAESYSFVVFVNPTDEQAQEIWKTLPNKIMGMIIIPSGVLAQANFVFSKNPEIALLKRAYGSYFQIFSREDLDTYKQSLSCFNELDTEFKALLEKRIGQ